MERISPEARSDAYGRRLNRTHSSMLATVTPWLSIILATIVPLFAIASGLPVIPPLGFLMLLGWRLQRPGLLPLWAGIPLGLVSDLFSGQPFGSGILLWSLAMLAIEVVESRFPWRGFLQDWLAASLVASVYLLVGMVFSGAKISAWSVGVLAPQILASWLIFPLVALLVAKLDRFRLRRFLTVS